jgi:hypothetical protein
MLESKFSERFVRAVVVARNYSVRAWHLRREGGAQKKIAQTARFHAAGAGIGQKTTEWCG